PGLRRHTLATRKACCFPKFEGPRCVSPVRGQAAVATSGAAALDRRISACDGGRYAACLHPCAVPPKQFFLVNFMERRITGVIRLLDRRAVVDRNGPLIQSRQVL